MEQRKLVHTERIEIRWGDMDAMGHVNNTVYFRYMEQARIGWFESLLPRGDAWRAIGIVIVNAPATSRSRSTIPARWRSRCSRIRRGLERADVSMNDGRTASCTPTAPRRWYSSTREAEAAAHPDDIRKRCNEPALDAVARARGADRAGALHELAGKSSYAELHRWSVEQQRGFLGAGVEVRPGARRAGRRARDRSRRMPGAKWFPRGSSTTRTTCCAARLGDAIVFWGEDRIKRRITQKIFSILVSRLRRRSGRRREEGRPRRRLSAERAGSHRRAARHREHRRGLVELLAGFRRAGRARPLRPDRAEVLFCADGYLYGGKEFDSPGEGEPGARQAAERRGVRGHRLLGATGEGGHLAVRFLEPFPAAQIAFEPVEFNHPLYILYSSGTTGVPKCIVHGDRRRAAPALKEHRLQSDVRPAIACSTSRPSAG
jgi:hypothetical protein